MRILARVELEALCSLAREGGRTLIGPTVRDGAIVLSAINGASELPLRWTDSQGPGRYRLVAREDERAFGYVVGPNSPKELFFAPRETLYRAERRPDGKLGFTPVVPSPAPKALLGVRACDLAAIAVQDRVFEGDHREPRYGARREDTIVIAVHCLEPGPLCFCASTGTGPRVTSGADLSLAERAEDFIVEAHTERGAALLARLPSAEASARDAAWLDAAIDGARAKMGQAIVTEGLGDKLFAALDHPRWKDVASRCISCGNCTSVCPTCFCSTAEERSDLDGADSTHERVWDSCFSHEHGELHGHSVRAKTEDRYRQWVTHKLGSWVSQFGSSGCVGCGRCVAWCPAGIDLRAEVRALTEGTGTVTDAWLPAAAVACEGEVENLTPRVAKVRRASRESSDVVTLTVALEGASGEAFAPGQFLQLSLPAVGEAPISISGDAGEGACELTIRAVGSLTTALCALSEGDSLGVRGPYGRGWPMDELAGGPVIVVAGGIGLAPLREALRRMLADPGRFPSVSLFYGARTPEDLLYAREMLGWIERPGFALHTTVDRAGPTWRGNVGVVTRLLHRSKIAPGARAILCGPETMMRFTIEALLERGVTADRQWLTMERHMKCATGTCGRCQYGPYFVCKDGPVFRYDEVRTLLGRNDF